MKYLIPSHSPTKRHSDFSGPLHQPRFYLGVSIAMAPSQVDCRLPWVSKGREGFGFRLRLGYGLCL